MVGGLGGGREGQHPHYSKRDAKKATTELLLPNTKNQLAVHLQQNNVRIKYTDVAIEIGVRKGSRENVDFTSY